MRLVSIVFILLPLAITGCALTSPKRNDHSDWQAEKKDWESAPTYSSKRKAKVEKNSKSCERSTSIQKKVETDSEGFAKGDVWGSSSNKVTKCVPQNKKSKTDTADDDW